MAFHNYCLVTNLWINGMYVCRYINVCMYVCVHLRIYVCIYMCMYYVYVCIYVCSFSPFRQFLLILWNLTIDCHLHNRLPLVLYWVRLIQSKPAHPVYLSTNSLLFSYLHLRLPNCLFPSSCPTELYAFLLALMRATCPRIILFLLQLPPTYSYVLGLRPKYLLQHPIVEYAQVLFPWCERQCFTPLQNNKNHTHVHIYVFMYLCLCVCLYAYMYTSKHALTSCIYPCKSLCTMQRD